MIPEYELILLLARGTVSPPLQERARSLLSKPLDWDGIVNRVAVEEVYPLFYRNLRNLGFDGVPAHGRKRIRDLAKINALQSTLLGEELARLLKILSAAGIPTIPLKGGVLAEALYGDPTLRASADIDILVPRRAVARAFDLMLAGGYESEFGTGFFADLLLQNDIEYALTREDRGFSYLLELHWGVLWGGQNEENITEDLWAEAYSGTMLGAPAYGLSSEWQLLFLAAHAARHQWQGLKWLVDIHELISTSGIDWDRVVEKAGRLGWEELLRLTFL
ncbi:MAG: nucleotidyltransferase family protein, partial [Deltaproteobacteria bacterium]|nr:nucleotidyltransferase family protein [Deltaproteobacteria bacterium]